MDTQLFLAEMHKNLAEINKNSAEINKRVAEINNFIAEKCEQGFKNLEKGTLLTNSRQYTRWTKISGEIGEKLIKTTNLRFCKPVGHKTNTFRNISV